MAKAEKRKREDEDERAELSIEQRVTDKTMIDNLECSICFSLLDEPKNCPNGHSYCNKCITKWLKDHKSCPECKCKLTKETLNRNIFLEKYLSTLLVACQYSFKYNEKDGVWRGGRGICKEKILYSDLKKHEQECQFAFIDCKFNESCEQQRRKDMDDHEKICEYRIIICEDCEEEILFLKTKDHMNTCEYAEVNCEDCDKPVVRWELAHHPEDCQEAMISCPFFGNDCEEKIKRKDVAKHLEKKLIDHLIAQNGHLQKEISQLKESRNSYPLNIKWSGTLEKQMYIDFSINGIGFRANVDNYTDYLSFHLEVVSKNIKSLEVAVTYSFMWRDLIEVDDVTFKFEKDSLHLVSRLVPLEPQDPETFKATIKSIKIIEVTYN